MKTPLELAREIAAALIEIGTPVEIGWNDSAGLAVNSVGHWFNCPSCGWFAIQRNHKHCAECGRPIQWL